MGFTSFQIRAALTAVLALAAMGCGAGTDATGPTDEHPAIPQLTAAACAVWSCSIGDCQQDPALYGACCIYAATTEYPATSAPSCQAPPGGGGSPDWCNAGNTQAACLERRSEDTSFTGNCYAQPYIDSRGIAYAYGSTAWNTSFAMCVQ